MPQLDRDQFDELYRQHVAEIYRFVFYKVSSKETAEDITAQVFMQALEHLAKFQYQPGAKFSSWLYTIARNQVIDYYRKHKEVANVDEIDPIPVPETASSTVDEHIHQERVQVILKQLAPDDQEILTLRLWQEKSYSEVAKILQLNLVTARARYSRALKKFKQLYLQHYEA